MKTLSLVLQMLSFAVGLARRTAAAGSVAVAALCIAAPAAAQGASSGFSGSIYLLSAYGLRHAPAATALTDVAVTPDASPLLTVTSRTSLAVSHSFARASLVEMPADAIPGQYSRPKYALGFRSNAMKNLAHSLGFDAHTCLAPLIRSRLSFSPNGDAGGRVMVFARCSIY